MVRYHGNWCGPNWTAGQHKPTSELTDSDRNVPAIDGFDQCCKDHDIGIHDAETTEEIQEVNDRFIREAKEYGIKGQVASVLVGLAGPSQPNLQERGNMPSKKSNKRLRTGRGPTVFDPNYIEPDLGIFEDTGSDIGRVVEVGSELARQQEEDNSIRDVLLNARGEVERPRTGANISPPGASLSNTPRNPPAPRSFESPEERGRNQNDDFDSIDFARTTRDLRPPADDMDGDTPMTEAGRGIATLSARSGGRISGHDDRMTTPIAKIGPSFPYHNTEQAILEYHGSASINDCVSAGDTNRYLKVRMNTYVLPFSEMTGNAAAVNQVDWTRPSTGFSRQVIGRYVTLAGLNGASIDANFHRELNVFEDPLFADPAVTPWTLQKPAGAEYYKNHMKAYTVTKCEWTLYVHYPYHAIGGVESTNTEPNAAQVQVAVQNSHMAGHFLKPSNFAKGRIFTHYTTEGGTITPINPPVNAPTLAMERWTGVFQDKVTVPPNEVRVIRGTWVPGMVHHNPLSDNDVEVWSPIDVVPPSTHLEHLLVHFKRSANSADSSPPNYTLCMNFSINLKYHVQFKEPLSAIQYPLPTQSNPTGTAVNDRLLQVATAYNV